MASSTPNRFYGNRKSKQKTTSARLLTASLNSDQQERCWSPNTTPRRSHQFSSPASTSRSTRQVINRQLTPPCEKQATAVPRGCRCNDQHPTATPRGSDTVLDEHFQPKETLEDRTDLYAEQSENDSVDEESDFSGSTQVQVFQTIFKAVEVKVSCYRNNKQCFYKLFISKML